MQPETSGSFRKNHLERKSMQAKFDVGGDNFFKILKIIRNDQEHILIHRYNENQ